MANASPERKAAAANMLSSSEPGRSMSLDEVREVASNTMQHLLPPMISEEMMGLVRMQCVVFCTEHENGFITSDAPVVWFDPEGYKRPPLFRSPGLAMPKLEVTLPISPEQCVLIHHGTVAGNVSYRQAPDNFVTEINRRTRFYCKKHFVSRLGYVEPQWFDPGKEPRDSWE